MLRRLGHTGQGPTWTGQCDPHHRSVDQRGRGAAEHDAPASPSASPTPPASPEPTSGVPESQPLEGTSWAGTDSDGDYYVYRFLPSSQFNYTSPTGTFGGPGETWTQEGNQVTMKTDGGYSTRVGTIQGDTISGTGSNAAGASWTWTAQRQTSP